MNAEQLRPQIRAGLTLTGAMGPGYEQILSEPALDFLRQLVERFAPYRTRLLQAREQQQARYDAGELPGFRADTQAIRQDTSWRVAPIPADLLDRRVEITGPVERKMVINALNSGAKVFMCCFEDATAPTWANMVEGQINLRDANRGELSYQSPDGKHYALQANPAVLIARPRGLHLDERHIQYQGESIPGCLMDFALYFVHNYQARLAKGTGVYYYLPKLQSMEEAKWWEAVFCFTEDFFQVARGSIRATVLIETLPAVFQMEEMLYVMREHIVAMNCGRWDYIFSYIKTLRQHPDRILPDRHSLGMDKPFLNAYSRLLIQTTHRRGALAMGGMAAFIPSKDPQQMQQVLAKVRADKELEARNGHDGTWVAHPGLVSTAMAVFDRHLGERPNQLDKLRSEDAPIRAEDLLQPCDGPKDEAGMRKNIRVALQYIEAWISGKGCVPIYGLMEDAATAEISRTALWQWLKHGVCLDDGRPVTVALFQQLLQEEMQGLAQELGAERMAQSRFDQAQVLFAELTCAPQLADFLTLPGYRYLA
ncbi:malate synthase A [Balneatrix alpica]|uniref:malate synthase A n=1 Tax=Balneatrix alpica TaxID=75684 RepID=UPI002739A8A2|nr:malate synthase A [Balneatrix alpica]